jgi:hypothetical protein
MPLVEPKIDDRNYDQILAEALARIPVHNPEWTNFNDSDPGVTLLQLFAFMTESLLYRSNLVPERNRVKFLKLLGVPLEPAAAAEGIVTFSNPRGPLETKTLDPGLEVLAGRVPFRTQDGLDVLPVEAHAYYKSPLTGEQEAEARALYAQLYGSFLDEDEELGFYETKALEPPTSGAVFPTLNLTQGKDTSDGSLWVALLARSGEPEIMQQTRAAIANKVLALGVLPALTDATRVLLPGGPPSTAGQPNLLFQIPIGGTLPLDPEQRVARYRPLEARTTGDLLSEPGVAQLVLPGERELKLWDNLEPLEPGVGDFPPSLEDTDVLDRVITWIRIRLRGAAQNGDTSQLSARLSWVGINAARVTQHVRVFAEDLGQGTGEPDQVVTLVNTPVIRGSVQLTVNGETWKEVDDLMDAGPEVSVRGPRLTPSQPTPPTRPEDARVFTVDRESGEIRFGDGLHGARPPARSIIRANYDYGGGGEGNVGIGSISKSPNLAAGLKVTNPIPTWGGDDAETPEQAEDTVAGYLEHRDRLVSAKDIREITLRTPGVELGRVEVLPLVHPDAPDVLAQGVVTVLVIPSSDPTQPDAPRPDRLFLDTVCEYLNPRRVVTTELHVRGPEYVQVWVSAGIDVIPGWDVAPVREAVEQGLRDFLSPLSGGFEGTGWPLSKAVERLELWAVATRVEGVAKVNGVLLTDSTGASLDRVPIVGLQLPRLMGLSVGPGEPQALDELRGAAPPSDGKKVVPVPVVPPECR